MNSLLSALDVAIQKYWCSAANQMVHKTSIRYLRDTFDLLLVLIVLIPTLEIPLSFSEKNEVAYFLQNTLQILFTLSIGLHL